MQSLKKKIYKDAIMAMIIAVILHVISVMILDFATVFTADKLGAFAEAIFNLDIDYAMQNIAGLFGCLLIMIVGVPLSELVANFFMFKGALAHDEMLYGRFLSKEYQQAKQIEEGEVRYRLEMDPVHFRCNGVIMMSYLVALPFTAGLVLSKALVINVLFCVITFGMSLVKLILPLLIRQLEAKYDLKNREYQTAVRSYEVEMGTKPYMINLLGIKKNFIKQLDNLFESYYHQTLQKDIRCKTLSSQIEEGIQTLTLLGILIMGAIMVARGQIEAGSVVAMMGYLAVFDEILRKTSFIIKKIPIMKNLEDRLLLFYTDEEDLSGQAINEEALSVSINHLTFAYTDDARILENITIEVSPCDKLAICGPNGTGKSTLIKLISRLIKGYEGNIAINGIPLEQIAIKDLREQIAFVEQNPYLFTGTIEENIQIGNLQANEQAINSIMEEVGMLNLKNRKVQDVKTSLSGGEKQRISIARALIRNKNLIIMDEPSNHLDQEGIEWLCQLMHHYKEKTFIFVSHHDKLTACANKTIKL